jgi:hypothetical protein
MITKKICSKCRLYKSRLEFSKRKDSLDGLYGRCKSCVSNGKAKNYEKNKESVAEYGSKYYSKNKEYLIARQRKYYNDNRESLIKKQREYHRENKESANSYSAKYYLENRDSMIAKAVKFEREKIKKDPKFAMIKRIRCLTSQALSAKGLTKTTKTMEALGCTSDQFQRHIELQFSKGMNWANRDKWHLDHIVPISSAETEEDVIRLSHYLNLRPLWAEENLSKSKKQTHLI